MQVSYAKTILLTVRLGIAQPEELPEILTLLEICGLPGKGLTVHLPTILVAREPVGYREISVVNLKFVECIHEIRSL